MKTKILIIFFSIALLFSCNNLEEEVFSLKTNQNFFQTKEHAYSALNGAYSLVKSGWLYGQNFGAQMPLLGDNCWTIGKGVDWHSLAYKYYNAGSPKINSYWDGFYQTINQCNVVLERVPAMDIKQDDINQITGEAYFLRAVSYFNLVQMFGEVPLQLEETKSLEGSYLPRESIDMVYQQILGDLAEASGRLPENYNDNSKQRPTIWTVKSYLSKIYLTMAGWPLNLGVEYYTKARDVAADVIINGPYELLTDYGHLWDVIHEHSRESIWELDFIRADGYGSAMPNFTAPANSGLGLKTWGTVRFRKKFILDWLNATSEKGTQNDVIIMDQELDYRFEKTCLYQWINVNNGKTMRSFPHPNYGAAWQGYTYIRKFLDPDGVAQFGHENNFIVYRFADLLLLFAEAQNEVAGNPDESFTGLSALDAVNMLRERARAGDGNSRAFPLDLPSGLSKDEFRSLVFEERGWELAAEGHRWFDLIRTGNYEKYIKADSGGTFKGKPEPAIPYYDRNWLLPIPQDEINLNPAISSNNPGY